jgi:pilus assembly protein CpaB
VQTKPIVLILVLLAVGIAGLTAVLVNRFMAAQKAPEISQAVAEPAGGQVLVAAVDVKPGAVLKAEDLRYEPWPQGTPDQRFIRRKPGEDAKAAFVGAIARRPLATGEPLTADAVFRQDEAGVLSGMLSPGMRAVTLSINSTSGVAGFVLPHDHVDVMLIQDITGAAGKAPGVAIRGDVERFSSEVILTDVRVLAVDDKLTKADGGPNLAGKTVTVEVTPKDAEVLQIASKMGELGLALRSQAASDAPSVVPGFTSDIEVSRALQAVLGTGYPGSRARQVRVNRGGATMTQSFSN